MTLNPSSIVSSRNRDAKKTGLKSTASHWSTLITYHSTPCNEMLSDSKQSVTYTPEILALESFCVTLRRTPSLDLVISIELLECGQDKTALKVYRIDTSVLGWHAPISSDDFFLQ